VLFPLLNTSLLELPLFRCLPTLKPTLKTVTAEADPSAKTPADTTKFDLKEKSFDVVTPVAYPYYAPYGYTYPNASYPQVKGF
jgi:hypothetical protein